MKLQQSAELALLTASIFITMIGVGAVGHTGDVSVTTDLSFSKAFLSVTDIVCLAWQRGFGS